jgi:DNA-binding beta-propeller fold protein YncE
VGSFALDGAGNLYVQDLAANRVVALDAAGKTLREVALPSEKEAIIVDVTADAGGTLYAVDARGSMVWTAAKDATSFKPLTKSLKDVLSFPAFITVNKGRIYVVDQNGNGLVVLGADGTYLARRLSIGWNEGLVRYPSQLCISEGGEAYLADRQNNRVQVFSMK